MHVLPILWNAMRFYVFLENNYLPQFEYVPTSATKRRLRFVDICMWLYVTYHSELMYLSYTL